METGELILCLGALVMNQGRREEAARFFEQALAIDRETDNRAGEGLIRFL